jgi:hypothetical protein
LEAFDSLIFTYNGSEPPTETILAARYKNLLQRNFNKALGELVNSEA